MNDAYLEEFTRRLLQDALNQATRSYWLRRAETFEWVKPRLSDHHGGADNPALRAQWKRAHETAEACRRRAELALIHDEYPDDVRDALREAGEPWEPEPTARAS